MNAKNTSLILAVIIVLTVNACSETDDLLKDKNDLQLITEYYYDGETGEQVAVKDYVYDSLNRLVLEHYQDFNNDLSNKRIAYSYEANDIAQKSTHYYNQSEDFGSIKYEYESGLLIKETEYSTLGIAMSVNEHFYDNGRLDSTRYYWRYSDGLRYKGTLLFKYSNGLLTERLNRRPCKEVEVTRTYTYVGNLLSSECNTAGYCNFYTYNGSKLIKMESGREGSERVLEEEYAYEGGLLREKTMYSYPVYTFGDTLDISRIVYEYKSTNEL